MSGPRLCSAALLLLLSACSTVSLRARHDLAGLPRSALVSCAGIPDQDEVRDDQEVMVWKITHTASGALSLTTPLTVSLSWSGEGGCSVIVTLRQNRVQRVSYSGPARTWDGENGACAPLVRACVAKPGNPEISAAVR